MLVLSRRVGDAIVIGQNITVRVLGINGQVRLGIEAPEDTRVDREEIHAIRLERGDNPVRHAPATV